jgi:hypothetical protein
MAFNFYSVKPPYMENFKGTRTGSLYKGKNVKDLMIFTSPGCG